VTGPGSLTVTGPAGVEVGAKGKLGAVAAEDLLELGAGNKGYPGAEVGVTAQVALGGYSGMERQRSVIISQLRYPKCFKCWRKAFILLLWSAVEILPRLVEHIEYVKQLWSVPQLTVDQEA